MSKRLDPKAARMLGRGRGFGPDHHWTEPTPTSLAREAAGIWIEPDEWMRRRRQRIERKQQPKVHALDQPKPPAKEPRPELVEAAMKTVPPPLVTAEQNQRRKGRQPSRDRRAQFRQDKAGAPCTCGTAPDEVCLAHAALSGHRRHLRP